MKRKATLSLIAALILIGMTTGSLAEPVQAVAAKYGQHQYTVPSDNGFNTVGYYSTFPLELILGDRGEWKNVSGDKIKMRVRVTNTSYNMTVRAFETHMYAEDVWGNRIYGRDIYYYNTTTQTVGPGRAVYSDYMCMPQRSNIYKIYARINKVILTDGTILTNSDSSYNYWIIK